jgi:dUTPase
MTSFNSGFHNMIEQNSNYRLYHHNMDNLPNYAILYISTDNTELYKKYIELSSNHNNKLMSSEYPDSGVDIYVPDDITFDKHFESKFVNMQIKTKMVYYDSSKKTSLNCGFYSYPRSSLSKTDLMLANHTGIIDSGYRGNLIGAFRWLPSNTDDTTYTIIKHTRLLQICHPSLCPVYISVVDEIDDNTERGSSGFGSTGK